MTVLFSGTQTEPVMWAVSLHVSYIGHCSLSALHAIYTTDTSI
jgi:hypothetical protein